MSKLKLSEDRTATAVGLIIIAVALVVFSAAGLLLEPVSYKWNGVSELAAMFSGGNLLILGWLAASWQATVVIFTLQGKSWRDTVGFLPLYLIAVVASLIGGNGIANDLGLETVTFSQIIGLLINNIWGTPAWQPLPSPSIGTSRSRLTVTT